MKTYAGWVTILLINCNCISVKTDILQLKTLEIKDKDKQTDTRLLLYVFHYGCSRCNK